MPEYNHVSDGRPDGTMIGQDATTDKVGFYNTTPVVQPTTSAQAAWTASTTTQTTTTLETDIAALGVLTNAIRTALVAQGIIKGS